MNTTPHWRRVWMAVAGKCKRVSTPGASEALRLTKSCILEGITMYKPYTEESYKTCLTNISENVTNAEFKKFLQRLSKCLNLDAGMSWAVLCNYLMFECYKKVENFEEIVDIQPSQQEFIINVWQFYTLERMYLIRILNYILENHKNEEHPFYEEYDKFVEEATYKKIRQSLFGQLQQLITEIDYKNSTNCVELRQWVERCNDEQLQILLSILTTVAYEKFEVLELIQIFQIFKEHNFTHSPHNMEVTILSRSIILKSIQNAEVAVFLASFENFWSNQSLWYSHANEIDKMIQETSSSGNISVVLLGWVMLQSTLSDNMISYAYHTQLQEYLCTALNQNVFLHLLECVNDPVFKDSTAGLVMKTAVFTVLEVLCLRFGGDTVFEQKESIDLLSQLLHTEQLGVLWFTGRNKGVISLYHSTVSIFPHQFQPLSSIAEALISLKWKSESVMEELHHMCFYVEKFVGNEHEAMRVKEHKIDKTYTPYQNDLVVFPPGTTVTFVNKFNQVFTTIHGNYSYFRVLQQLINQLFDEIEHHVFNENTENAMTAGFKVLTAILKVDHNIAYNSPDIKELVRLSHCLFFTTVKMNAKNIKSAIYCFEILIHRMKHNQNPDEIVEHLRNTKCLPQISKSNFIGEDFFNSNLLTQSTLIQYIQEECTNRGTYDLLSLYMDLIQAAMNMDKYYFEIQIPGLMFLILKVFPMTVDGFYTNDANKREVSVKLVKMVYNILHKDRKLLSTLGQLIYDCVIELFMSRTLYISSLSKIFEIGNTRLELFLTAEMNWKDGLMLQIVKTVRRALCCFMFLLSSISSHTALEKYKSLEEYLYLNYEVSSLKCIAGYINHGFDMEIPKIACGILSTFAKLSRKPLLQSLELDDYQIQRMFLDRLRDPLTEDNLKIAILELITACIKDQTSMVAAFFHVSPMGNVPDTSILSFMREYLQNIEKDPSSLTHPLQAAVLDLFHGLWKMGKQHIIKKLIEEENFWVSMTAPLFNKTVGVKIEALLLIVEILTMNMYTDKKKVDRNFAKAITNIFENSNMFIDIWVNRLVAVTEKNSTMLAEEISLPAAFLTIWKKFILAARHFYPEYCNREWNTPTIEQKCFRTLLLCTKKPSELLVMTLWAELCLTFSTVKSEDEQKEILNIMVEINVNFSQIYEIVDNSCRTTVLTLACVVLKHSEKIIASNVSYMYFLLPFGNIFKLEYKNILGTSDTEGDRQQEKFYYNWLLILRVINNFLRLDISVCCENFYLNICYLEKIADAVAFFVNSALPVKITEITAMTFIDYAESSLVKHYDKSYQYIVNVLIPPNKYYSKDNQLLIGNIPHFKNWWAVFSYILRLCGIILHKRKGYMAKEILSFLITHHLVFIDGIMSATVIAESCNLKMVIDMLHFLYDILNYMDQWTLLHRSSFVAVMNSIKEVVNTAIGVILRPKILVFVPVNPNYSSRIQTEVPEENLVNISNNFLEIMTWACMCFSRCSPPFIQLLDIYRPSNFYSFLEYDFRVPPLVNTSPQILTYGSLLCGLHFICKTLSQISLQQKEKAQESSLNVTPKSHDLSTDEASKPGTSALENQRSSTTQLEDIRTKLPDFNVLIFPSYTKETPETISALHRFTIPETMGVHSWLIRLNPDNLLLALNAVNTFLAGQAFLTVHNTRLERSVMRYIRRELCSELLFFYDFVNKYIFERNAVVTPATPGEYSTVATKSRNIAPQVKTYRGFYLNVDVQKICINRPHGKSTVITSIDDCYLLVLAHWFRHVCRLVHYSKFDEFLSQWHAKSTCVLPDNMYVKNTSVRISDDEDDD